MQKIYSLMIVFTFMLALLTGVVAVIGYNVYVIRSDAEVGRETDEGFVEYMRGCISTSAEDRCRELWRWMSPHERFSYTEAGRQTQEKFSAERAAEDRRLEESCRARGKPNDPVCKLVVRVEERKKKNSNSSSGE